MSVSTVVPGSRPAASAGDDREVILVTTFEPSGDAHMAPVVRELLRRRPDLRVVAWGGPRLEEAGAEIVERTADDGVMGLGGFLKAYEIKKVIDRIDAWAAGHPVRLHVPVDSPSANFPICARLRARGARTVHFIAPKIWAWGSWRVERLRRHTDLTLCLLPFEERWFGERGVEARFVGHPVMAKPVDEVALAPHIAALPEGEPRVLVLPGSRSGEIQANLHHQLDAFARIRERHPGAVAYIRAANDRIEAMVRERIASLPAGVHLGRDDLEAAIAWADLALATSGTVSLDVARQSTPMVGSYAIAAWQMLVANIFIKAPFKLLPNIVADREVVPELVPYRRGLGCRPIVEAALPLLEDEGVRHRTIEELDGVRAAFEGFDPDLRSADAILEVLDR
ncbi:MAG: hypothetical protein VX672_05635 [Planctomycetota bacterium]|nr:hypothetical protein [Planctomycetota bacterium]